MPSKNTYSWERCDEFVRRLTAEGEYAQDDWDHNTPLVLKLVEELGITSADFWELDERPGQFDYKYRDSYWHAYLRRVRNGHIELFDILKRNSE